jgi:hypothetical protein
MKVLQQEKDPVIKEISEEKLENQRVFMLVTPQLLKILAGEKMDINQLFILLAMHDDYISLLDIYDKNSTRTRVMLMDYQTLVLHGFIRDSDSVKLYDLTEKGKSFLEKVLPLMEVAEEEKITEAAIKQLCQDYLMLFPKIKLPSGKYARVSSVEIEKKMKAWLRTYGPMFKKEGLKITGEHILTATKNYITRYAKDGYKFMVTSSYFIQKNEKSALADEILAIKDGLDAKPKTNIVTM